MPWIQAHLTVEKAQAPLIELLFQQLGAISVTLRDAADQPLLEPAPGQAPLWQQTCVSGLFSNDTDSSDLQRRIDQAMPGDSARSLQLETLQDQLWERAWLTEFQPLCCGRRLWICPAGKRPAAAADAVIVDLDPGLAFGTGTHQTTALCLEWLDASDLRGRTLIDFGCGSGILAVAALKLGAELVVAVDHDPQALQATTDNAEKNAVSSRLQICHSSQLPALRADILLANILAGTLVQLEPVLASHTRPGGSILLSGILSEQQRTVSLAYAADFELIASRSRDQWLLLEGRRR